MADERPTGTRELPQEIDLLLFHAGGVNMAVEAAQVDAIISSEQAEQRAISVGVLSKLLGMGSASSAACSKVLLFRDNDETCGVGISGLDSILPVKIGTIQPLPELLSNVAGLRPFWGAITRGNNVVFLIDLFRLKSLISHRPEIFA